jgi:hypothetical protein
MRVGAAAVAVISALVITQPANAQPRTFGGFDCTDDCSGHAAGYEWAEQHDIDDETTAQTAIPNPSTKGAWPTCRTQVAVRTKTMTEIP